MSQHFLLSPRAKTLNLAHVMRMTNEEAETMFARIRWPETDGAPVCPHCTGQAVYNVRRPNGPPRWRCKACNKEFTVTSGTLFAWHKLPVQAYLGAIAIFCNEVKGKAALALSRDLGTSYKTSFVLAHKLREAMATEKKGERIGGEGRTVEVDGAYFGGYVKPANLKENRRDRRLAGNKSGKREVVVVVREREGSTLPAVFKSESAALGWISSRVAKGTALVADEASSWNDLHNRYEISRIDHQQAYSLNGVYSNGARSFSGGYVALKWDITTMSPGRIWSATRRRVRGARTSGGSATGIRCSRLYRWRWRLGRAWISAGIGSGIRWLRPHRRIRRLAGCHGVRRTRYRRGSPLTVPTFMSTT